MDHSLGKELAQWTHSESYSQWLDVQVETSDQLYASGVGAVQYLCRRHGERD